MLSVLVGLTGIDAEAGSSIASVRTVQDSIRISDYPAGHVEAGTLSAGQRGLAVSPDGTVMAVWSDTREGRSNIYAARSKDGGHAFGPNMRVNDAPGTTGLFGATVTLDRQNRAHVVWFDRRDGDDDIFYAQERPDGVGFATNVRVNDDKTAQAASSEFEQDEFFETDAGRSGAAYQTLPSLAVDRQGVVYVAWQDYRRDQADIYVARSTDGGRSFGPNVRVNDDLGRAGQLSPALAVDDSGAVYVAWHDMRAGNPDIYFARSTDGGKTFTRNARVNDDPGTAGQYDPSLAVDSLGGVHIVWHDLRHGQPDIYLTTSRDLGKTFGPNRRVNDDPGEAYQFHPSVALNGEADVAIAWEDYRNGHADIFLSFSGDKGATFSPNLRLADDQKPVTRLHASLAGTAHRAFLVIWEDQRNEPPERPCRPVHCADIYLARITN